MFNRIRLILCLTIVCLPLGWLLSAKADDSAKSREHFSATQKEFAAKMLDAVKDYERFGRVDDEMRWSPFLCRMPVPGRAWFSQSNDGDTHGRKLYSLFAKDNKAFSELHSKPGLVAPGQVLIKESWIPEEVTSKAELDAIGKLPWKTVAPAKPSLRFMDHFFPYASSGDGKTYKASKKAGLFVMMKLDPKTPETDAGWVYGTIGADLKSVTAIGKIDSCMRCHVKAKHDRLLSFGAK